MLPILGTIQAIGFVCIVLFLLVVALAALIGELTWAALRSISLVYILLALLIVGMSLAPSNSGYEVNYDTVEQSNE